MRNDTTENKRSGGKFDFVIFSLYFFFSAINSVNTESRTEEGGCLITSRSEEIVMSTWHVRGHFSLTFNHISYKCEENLDVCCLTFVATS